MARGQCSGHPWGRPIAEVSVVVAFDLYYTESKKPPHAELFEGQGLFVSKQLGGGGCLEGSLLKGAGLIEPLRY